MDIQWTGSVMINAPIERVYAYLADFPRHAEWAQSVQKLTVTKPGNTDGSGTIYRTAERQGWQNNRRPFAPLSEGMVGDTMCQVVELTPKRLIIWRSWVPYPGVTHAGDYQFQLEAMTGGTRLTQRIHLYDNWIGDLINRYVFKTTEPKAYAQWQASLQNIKTILEDHTLMQTAPQALQQGGAYVA